MDDHRRMEELADYMGRVLDGLKRLVPPKDDNAGAQAAVVEGLCKIAYTYGVVAGMPPEIFLFIVVNAMNDVEKLVAKVHAERVTATSTGLSEAQTREILARFKEGGHVH